LNIRKKHLDANGECEIAMVRFLSYNGQSKKTMQFLVEAYPYATTVLFYNDITLVYLGFVNFDRDSLPMIQTSRTERLSRVLN